MKTLNFKTSDGLLKYYTYLENRGPNKGLVLILHGVNEHKGRYKTLQERLDQMGYSSICSDRRGHGQSINEDYPTGHMGSLNRILQDEIELFQMVKKEEKVQDIFLFSHSYGSLLSRLLLKYLDKDLKGIVLAGTTPQRLDALFPLILANGLTIGRDPRSRSNVLKKIGYGTNNKDLSWISANPAQIRDYLADPLCRFHYSRQSYGTIFQASFRLCHRFRAKNPQLPILSLVGGKDPLVQGERGHRASLSHLKKFGYRNVKKYTFPDLHHEVLNSNEDKVYREISKFFLNL